MSEEFLEKLNRLKKEIGLAPERKILLLEEIVRKMEEFRPLKMTGQRSVLDNLFYKYMPIIAYVLIAALVGGGVTVAAEQAVPGEILYPVKVAVVEKVGEALAFSAEAKADWEAKLAARRLEEAAKIEAKEELAAEKKAELKAELEERFEKHAERVQERIAKLEAKGKARVAAKVAERFERSLEAHKDVLAKVGMALDKVAEIKLELELKAAAEAEVEVEDEIEEEGKEKEEKVKLKEKKKEKEVEVKTEIPGLKVKIKLE